MLSSHTIFSVKELNEDFTTRTDGTIVLDHDIFEGFHKST